MQQPPLSEYSQELQLFLSKDGRGEMVLPIRLIRPGDKQRLLDFFQSHTDATIYLRYGMMMRELSDERLEELVRLDGHTEQALIALDGPTNAEFIVAVGRYFVEEATGLAEVAFVVHERYRGMGIATHLLRHLAQILRDKGFSGITAHVLEDNEPMLQVFARVLGPADQTTSGSGETTLIFRFKDVG